MFRVTLVSLHSLKILYEPVCRSLVGQAHDLSTAKTIAIFP